MTSLALDRELSPSRTTGLALLAGVVVGVCYVLSPLSVVCLLAIIVLLRWAGDGLDEGERRWLYAILVTAVIVRMLVILGLFLITDHQTVPFGHIFGDEDYFIRRSLWLSPPTDKPFGWSAWCCSLLLHCWARSTSLRPSFSCAHPG